MSDSPTPPASPDSRILTDLWVKEGDAWVHYYTDASPSVSKWRKVFDAICRRARSTVTGGNE